MLILSDFLIGPFLLALADIVKSLTDVIIQYSNTDWSVDFLLNLKGSTSSNTSTYASWSIFLKSANN